MEMEALEAQTATEVQVVAATSEDQTIMVTSVALVAMEISEGHRVTEVLVVAAASEAHRVTEALVETTLEVHRVMESQVEITSEAQTVTEAQVEITSEAQMAMEALREDLREPLQMADAETGPTTKAVPTIV